MAVRRVRRIIRRIDPWTMLKVSFVFNVIAALTFVLGSVIFWTVFVNAGVPDKFIDFFENLGITLTLDGGLYFRVVILLAVIWAVLMTGLLTLGAVLYNLIADAVGGLEVVVLEESLTPQNGQQAVRAVRRPTKPKLQPKRQVKAPVRPAKQAAAPLGGPESGEHQRVEPPTEPPAPPTDPPARATEPPSSTDRPTEETPVAG